MPEPNELVTVFRSADAMADLDASAVCELLEEAGLSPQLLSDQDIGVPVGTYEVRVPAAEAVQAEALIEARGGNIQLVDPSPALDLVGVFRSNRHDAENEAMTVKGLLDAAGIDAVLVGPSVIPSLDFEVRVARENEQQALSLIREAEISGPQAAEAAEQAIEQGGEG